VCISSREWQELPGGLAARGAALLQLVHSQVGGAPWLWASEPRRGEAGAAALAWQQADDVMAAAALGRHLQPATGGGGGAARQLAPGEGDGSLYAAGDAEVVLAGPGMGVGAGGRGLAPPALLAGLDLGPGWSAGEDAGGSSAAGAEQQLVSRAPY